MFLESRSKEHFLFSFLPFQTFFSSHFLLVLFLFSEYAALVLALIPPDPPFVASTELSGAVPESA